MAAKCVPAMNAASDSRIIKWHHAENMTDPFRSSSSSANRCFSLSSSVIELQLRLCAFGFAWRVEQTNNNPIVRMGGDGSNVEVSIDRKSTRLNSSHLGISYAVFCLK